MYIRNMKYLEVKNFVVLLPFFTPSRRYTCICLTATVPMMKYDMYNGDTTRTVIKLDHGPLVPCNFVDICCAYTGGLMVLRLFI